MKILFITSGNGSMPSVINGGAVSTLIEHLIKKNETEKKYEITVVSAFEKSSFEEGKKHKKTKYVYIHRNKNIVKILSIYSRVFLKFFPKYYNKFNLELIDYLYKIKRTINFEEYDSIIIENMSTYINGLKGIEKNKGLYLHLHNDYLPWEDTRSEIIYNKCKNILVVSDYIKKCTLSPKFEEDKIKIFFNCVDIDLFNKDLYLNEKQKLKEKLGIKEEDIVFMFSGRLTKQKGIDKLLEAFSMLEYKNIKLLILGSYDYGKKDKNSFIISLEEKFKLFKDKIIFTGFINRDDIPKYHAISDIAIIPSIWEDPCPLTVFEALSSGLPLITTDSGGIPEIVDENSTFIIKRNKDFIKNLKEKMEFLYLKPEERKLRGEAGRKYIEKYNLDFYWEQFKKIMEEN